MDPVNPAHVYTHAMTISPSANFICRDWGQNSGVNTPFNKEHLLALIPWNTGSSIHNTESSTHDFNAYSIQGWDMFQGS